MDILGKNIDPEVLQKIADVLKTPEGNKLKSQMQNVDKESLMNLLTQMNMSQQDIVEASNKIKELSQAELMNKIFEKLRRS